MFGLGKYGSGGRLVVLVRRNACDSSSNLRNPGVDPDARITKMKDGRTHLAHKAEHAVDMESGAIVAVTLHGADEGDTKTLNMPPGVTVASYVHLVNRARAELQWLLNELAGVEVPTNTVT